VLAIWGRSAVHQTQWATRTRLVVLQMDKVTNVEIKNVDLDENMVRVIARQAVAERERRAKVILAEGEKQAAQTPLEAAQMLARQPEAMQLRYLQTMTSVAGDRGSTIVFPLPMDLLQSMFGRSR
jgi:regulator of protease activity HflC (stomatin/prohibitin superfamily)